MPPEISLLQPSTPELLGALLQAKRSFSACRRTSKEPELRYDLIVTIRTTFCRSVPAYRRQRAYARFLPTPGLTEVKRVLS
jgi:hypothetical protein